MKCFCVPLPCTARHGVGVATLYVRAPLERGWLFLLCHAGWGLLRLSHLQTRPKAFSCFFVHPWIIWGPLPPDPYAFHFTACGRVRAREA